VVDFLQHDDVGVGGDQRADHVVEGGVDHQHIGGGDPQRDTVLLGVR
jgi:hypothetical protein